MGPAKPDIPRAQAFGGSDIKPQRAQLSARTTLCQNLACPLQGDSGGIAIFSNTPGISFSLASQGAHFSPLHPVTHGGGKWSTQERIYNSNPGSDTSCGDPGHDLNPPKWKVYPEAWGPGSLECLASEPKGRL